MRIALCLEYPIDQFGGTEILVRELIRGLAREHEILLVSADTPEAMQQSSIASMVREHLRWQPAGAGRAQGRQLAAELARRRIDLAHFHFGGQFGWNNRFPFQSPIYFLHRLGVPCLSTVHSVMDLLGSYCGAQRPFWFKLLMLPLAWWGKVQQLRSVVYEVAVSQHDLRRLQRYYGCEQKRLKQLYHSRLRRGEVITTAGREKTILNVGHLTWRKGQTTLAEAFARLAPRHRDWTLQLVGPDHDGQTSRQILDIATRHKLGERILLMGQRADAFPLMQRAGIYVQPSLWEALGLGLQEAMFCGCAVVGSRAGGIPELIAEGQSGLLFEPGNVEELSSIMENLIQDETRRQALGQAAANSVRERGMTVEAMVQRYLELYESAVAR